MNIINKVKLIILLVAALPVVAFAGNPDRVGQAGASELLVNPWAKSLGWNGINIAAVKGIESMRLNIAGLSRMQGTQIGFSRTEYLVGSDININALGFATKIGEGALGISIMSVGYGEIQITTVNQPEGGIGTYQPQFLNIGLGYSRSFADFIHGGIVLRIVSESIADVSAQGVALDAGLIYNTGPDAYPEKFKFGVSLRNVGTPMTYRGDGLSFRTDALSGEYQITVDGRSQSFELPSQLNIGASYDMYVLPIHRLTAVASFTSNAFYKDQIGLGLEYGIKVGALEMFQLRAGYKYEEGLLFDTALRTNAHTGLSAGFTFEYPFRKDDPNSPKVGLDYAYKTSNPFAGSHTVGVRLNM